MRRSFVASLCLLSAAASAFGQTRPLQTEEATTAGSGRVALEAGASGMTQEPSFLSGKGRTRYDLPALNFVYSPSDNVEIDVAWAGRLIAVQDPAFGTISDWGDVTLRAKVRLVQNAKGDSALAARFTVSLPQTDAVVGLGPNTLRMSAQVLATKTLGKATLHANLGIAIHDEIDTPQTQNDFLAYGLAVERRIGGRYRLLAEVAGRAGQGEPVIERTHEARAGVRWEGARLRWDAAVRRGLSDADGAWGLTAGVTWTLRPPRVPPTEAPAPE